MGFKGCILKTESCKMGTIKGNRRGPLVNSLIVLKSGGTHVGPVHSVGMVRGRLVVCGESCGYTRPDHGPWREEGGPGSLPTTPSLNLMWSVYLWENCAKDVWCIKEYNESEQGNTWAESYEYIFSVKNTRDITFEH